jgi:hypothetical protein
MTEEGGESTEDATKDVTCERVTNQGGSVTAGATKDVI